METYKKIRDAVDNRIKKFTANPEAIIENIKLADVVVVVGGLILFNLVLNILSTTLGLLFI